MDCGGGCRLKAGREPQECGARVPRGGEADTVGAPHTLEGRFVGVRAGAPAAGVAPGRCAPGIVLRRGLLPAAPTAGTGTGSGVAAEPATAAAEAATVAAAKAALPAAGALGAGDLRGGVAQRGADFVDLKLDDGALFAFLGFVRTRLQA